MFSEQQKQWVLDKKTEEYRELLSTLTANVERMARYSIEFGMPFPNKTEEHKRVIFERAASRGKAVIQDRIFIARVVATCEILDRWEALAGERNEDKFWDYWELLHRDIIEAARKDLKIKIAVPGQL